MNLKIKKKDSWAMTPTYGTDDSAGADLYAGEDGVVLIAPGETKLISTGISMEIPKGYVGLLVARSSMAVKRDLAPANKVGIIDSDYRGEIKVALHNSGRQLVIVPYLKATFEDAVELSDSERGEGGFGSTGRM